MTCERCGARRAYYVVWDEVENEAAGMLLCGACLVATELDGPWDGVELLEPELGAPAKDTARRGA